MNNEMLNDFTFMHNLINNCKTKDELINEISDIIFNKFDESKVEKNNDRCIKDTRYFNFKDEDNMNTPCEHPDDIFDINGLISLFDDINVSEEDEENEVPHLTEQEIKELNFYKDENGCFDFRPVSNDRKTLKRLVTNFEKYCDMKDGKPYDPIFGIYETNDDNSFTTHAYFRSFDDGSKEGESYIKTPKQKIKENSDLIKCSKNEHPKCENNVKCSCNKCEEDKEYGTYSDKDRKIEINEKSEKESAIGEINIFTVNKNRELNSALKTIIKSKFKGFDVTESYNPDIIIFAHSKNDKENSIINNISNIMSIHFKSGRAVYFYDIDNDILKRIFDLKDIENLKINNTSKK